jgi:hypothetical protein
MFQVLRYCLTSETHFDDATTLKILAPLNVPAQRLRKWRYKSTFHSSSAGQVLQGIASGYRSGLREEQRRGTDRTTLLSSIEDQAGSLRATVLELYESEQGILFDLHYAGTLKSEIPKAREHLFRQLETITEAASSGLDMARSFPPYPSRSRGEHGKPYLERAVFQLCDLGYDLTGEYLTATRSRAKKTTEGGSIDALAMSGTAGGQFLERFFRELKSLFPRSFGAGGVTATTVERAVSRWARARRDQRTQ